MFKKLLVAIFYASLAFSCKGMMIVQLADSPGSYAYIPTNMEDYQLIGFWRRFYTVHPLPLIDANGVSTTGYILINGSGMQLPLSCASQSATGMLFQTISGGGASGAVSTNLLLSASPQQVPRMLMQPSTMGGAASTIDSFPVGGNPRCDTVCIDSMVGKCQRPRCGYRHLSEQQKKAVDHQRTVNGKKERRICTNPTPHDIISCPFLHIPDN